MKIPLQKIQTVKSKGIAVEELELTLPQPTPELDSYLIAQLSDLHFGPCTSLRHIQEAFELVKEAAPDLILLTGDYLQYSNTGLHHILATKVSPKLFRWSEYRRVTSKLAKTLGEQLTNLTPHDGMIGVFGNHDYHEGIGSIRRQFPQDIRWLINESTLVQRGGARILISGIDDMREGQPDLVSTHSQAFAASNADCKILLSHSPDVSIVEEEQLLEDYDLILSGHTHGGQLCLPGGIPIVTRSEQRTHFSGIGMHRSTPLYVNRGLGYGGLPLRTFCPPEITLIRLRQPLSP